MKSEIEEILKAYQRWNLNYTDDYLTTEEATAKLEQLIPDTTKVDRLEVIDDTGRAYVKGSIYGSPVKVELSYQDDGRTLKVFVEQRLTELEER